MLSILKVSTLREFELSTSLTMAQGLQAARQLPRPPAPILVTLTLVPIQSVIRLELPIVNWFE